MNLAPWKYRNISMADGGPILKIEHSVVDSPYLQRVHEAYAELNPRLKPSALPSHNAKVYGSADGNGTSPFRNQAIYKSVSEALERWAFYEIALNQGSNQYGFSDDRSTTGMAAFPDLTGKQAEINAFYEAVERWSLCSWWEGRLRATRFTRPTFYDGIEIESQSLFGIPTCTVLLWSKIQSGWCYGFSCAGKRANAVARALVELDRNRRVLADQPNASEVTEVGEKRLLFFASPEGHLSFLARVQASLALKIQLQAPKLIANSIIRGPWSAYCHVWRCLFEPISVESESDRFDYFLF